MLSGFPYKNLVAVMIKYLEDEMERLVVICSAYLPYDSKGPPTMELEELVRYCEEEHLYLIIGCNSNANHTAWGSTNYNGREEALMEFRGGSNLEILNPGKPTFCNGYRSEVIEITLGCFGLLKNVRSWEVSFEPSVSDQTYSVHCLGLCAGVSNQES
jgi:hypothetical protein